MLQARNTAIAYRSDAVPDFRPSGKQLEEKQLRSGRSKSLPFLLLIGCFIFALVVIAQYCSMVTLHYRLGRAESRLEALQEEYHQLELETAKLGSLARIEMVARSELGMREPESGQLRVLTATRESGPAAGE